MFFKTTPVLTLADNPPAQHLAQKDKTFGWMNNFPKVGLFLNHQGRLRIWILFIARGPLILFRGFCPLVIVFSPYCLFGSDWAWTSVRADERPVEAHCVRLSVLLHMVPQSGVCRQLPLPLFLWFPLVSRLHCESESFKMDLILDVNIQIYPVDLGKYWTQTIEGDFLLFQLFFTLRYYHYFQVTSSDWS